MQAVATLDLLPRKVFEIKLSDGSVIKGQFSTWALRRFCDKNGNEDVGKNLQTVGGFLDYLLFSVEYVSRKEKAPFSFTDVNASEWVDELGGLSSELALKLMAHSGEEDSEEKKTTPVE